MSREGHWSLSLKVNGKKGQWDLDDAGLDGMVS